MNISDFKVGGTVYFVPLRRGGKPSQHVIVSIGRKWVTAAPDGVGKWGQFRFDPRTMHADGGKYGSPGTYYLTESEYKTEMEANSAWQELMDFLRFRARPQHISKADITKVRELLGLA